MGQPQPGLALLDEAMIAVEAGEVSPMFAGEIYCSVIEACFEIFDMRRAQEWTAALTQWCEAQPDLVAYSGQCLVRRAEILQLHGEWTEAVDLARRACERYLEGPDQPAIGAAYYQQAELHRLLGDYSRADELYREASRRGKQPQPGLALLKLAQGEVAAAAASIRSTLTAASVTSARCRLLPAYVEIMLAAKDLDAARSAADELEQIAKSLDAPLVRACAAEARGAVLLATGDAARAVLALQDSRSAWEQVDARYQTGRVRTMLGLACRELGDQATADLELDAARWIFERLSAGPDLRRLQALVADRPAEKGDGGLTSRELEVLQLLAAGHTNRVIGQKLSISEKTVARHVANIFTRLNLPNRAAATAWAYQHGLAGNPPAR
jgi:ATP/maltotriose-dependent transcriptional regulator MalT